MGFLGRIFGHRPEPVAMLEEAIERLQFGIITSLIVDYGTRLKLSHPSEAALLANCVLSYATAMNPIGDLAKEYYKTHFDLVRKQALELAELTQINKSISYLYAAITLLLAIKTKNPFSELASQLCDRATELSLDIPNTFDICGSGDALECIKVIAAYADVKQVSGFGNKDPN